MKKILYLTLALLVVIAVGSIPSQSNFANHNVVLAVPETIFQIDEHPSLAITSFNIQFLGQSRKRDDAALAIILRD
jgi:hypothetical protein